MRAKPRGISARHLQPTLNDTDNVLHLFRSQGTALRDPMPPGQAFPATRARGMLGNEDGMIPERRLPSVIFGTSRSQAAFDKARSMREDTGQSVNV